MKTIAVMNQKGGTGKTTSAINLAGELVRRGKKVLIVDMDTQGNATSNLSLTEIPAATLTDVIVSKTATLADTVCHTTTENLDLIRGGSLLAPALATMQEMPFGRDTTLRRLLPQIPDTYDFVFFDCSPSLRACSISTCWWLFSTSSSPSRWIKTPSRATTSCWRPSSPSARSPTRTSGPWASS